MQNHKIKNGVGAQFKNFIRNKKVNSKKRQHSFTYVKWLKKINTAINRTSS